MLTLTKAAGVGQFYALKMPQSGSILCAQFHRPHNGPTTPKQLETREVRRGSMSALRAAAAASDNAALMSFQVLSISLYCSCSRAGCRGISDAQLVTLGCVLCARRSDGTDVPSGIASGRLAVGSALTLSHLLVTERLSPATRERVHVRMVQHRCLASLLTACQAGKLLARTPMPSFEVIVPCSRLPPLPSWPVGCQPLESVFECAERVRQVLQPRQENLQ